MSLLKIQKTKRQDFYARTFVSATDLMIDPLHEQGVKEETHPVFKIADTIIVIGQNLLMN